jgi:nucleoside-diphosphate-sugar epimerase
MSGESVIVKDPVRTVADFSAVEDVVEGLELAGSLPAAAGEIFNISRGRGRTLMELVRIAQRLAPDINVIFEPADDPTRPKRGALDVSKARERLGFIPKVDLETGLARCFARMKASADLPVAEFNTEAHATVA